MKACKYGHTDGRYANGQCRACARARTRARMERAKTLDPEAFRRDKAEWQKSKTGRVSHLAACHKYIEANEFLHQARCRRVGLRKTYGPDVGPVLSDKDIRTVAALYERSRAITSETKLRHCVTFIIKPRDGGQFVPDNLVVAQWQRTNAAKAKRVQQHEARKYSKRAG